MRICIWYHTTQAAWGGSNSFLRSLAAQLERLGHEISRIPRRTDEIVLVNSWSQGGGRYLNPKAVASVQQGGSSGQLPSILGKLYGGGKPLVQRADGVARLYGRDDPRADQTQFEIARLADCVIFQSQYSQASFAQAGVRPRQVQVIYNAVDGSVFYPSPEIQAVHSRQDLRLLAVSWSANPMKGFADLARLADLPGVKLRFVGNWCPEEAPGKVQLLGRKTRSEIAALLRQSDVFVHAAQNDPCSNAILEALASGLPILYHDSGGNPELAQGYGLALTGDPGSVVAAMRLNYTQFRQKVLDNRAAFLIEGCAEKYLGVFCQVIEEHGTLGRAR
ncbi:MAG: glycosyltransferase family 4 protein [Chloroflexota bacterium]